MQRIDVECKNESYPIFIGELPQKLEFEGSVLVVTNSKVAGIHLRTLLQCIYAKECFVCVLEDGEEYKNIQSVQRILETAFIHKLDRQSTMIAFGGGVVGDIVGFAAGIFMRGISFVQIPTTLLAQVDASIGGKTAINNKFGKNLIGLFHQPKAVYVNPFFLGTLSHREKSSGIAEIIKMAVMFDKDFFEWLSMQNLQGSSLLEAIMRAILIKKEVVVKDELERGVRMALNYGHTFGHVIEKETQYKQYLHGEAVSMGMIMANRLAVQLGYLSVDEEFRIQKILEKNDLPIYYKIPSMESFYQSLFLDKKNENHQIRFILPHNIGRFIPCTHLSKAEIMRTLEEFCDD
nr:3-dehydroquinate synthase [Helicobacter sp. 15-1451]